ncbi:hypothetical protein DSECCO2_595830 [anaerobic digester metagenome]
MFLDRHRLAGEGRLVDREEVSFNELDICGYDVSVPDPDDVPGNEVSCGDLLPLAVAKRPGLECEPLL